MGMREFDSLLTDILKERSIEDLVRLTEILNQQEIRQDDPSFSLEHVRVVLRGEAEPHPAFFRCLQEGLDLDDEMRVRLAWAFFSDDPYPEEVDFEAVRSKFGPLGSPPSS